MMRTRGHTVGKMVLLVAATVALASLGGCHGWRKASKGKNRQDTTSVQNTTQKTNADKKEAVDAVTDLKFNTLTMSFTCSVEGMNVSGQIRMLNDSIIWVCCSKIIEVGRALITPTRVQAYSRLLGKSIDAGYPALRSRWGIDVDFKTLQALLTGNRIPDCVLDGVPVQKGDSVVIVAKQTVPGRSVEMVKDMKNGKIVSTKMYTSAVSQSLVCRYAKQQTVDGQSVPHETGVALQSRKFNVKTTLKMSNIKVNQEQTYPFTMPAKK